MAITPNKKTKKGLGRVRFLAHIDVIRQQLEEGWPKSAVLENLTAELDMSYQQFLRYVDEYIKRGAAKPRSPESPTKGAATEPDVAAAKPAAPAPVKKRAELAQEERRQRGFVFDPTAVDRKNLI